MRRGTSRLSTDLLNLSLFPNYRILSHFRSLTDPGVMLSVFQTCGPRYVCVFARVCVRGGSTWAASNRSTTTPNHVSTAAVSVASPTS